MSVPRARSRLYIDAASVPRPSREPHVRSALCVLASVGGRHEWDEVVDGTSWHGAGGAPRRGVGRQRHKASSASGAGDRNARPGLCPTRSCARPRRRSIGPSTRPACGSSGSARRHHRRRRTPLKLYLVGGSTPGPRGNDVPGATIVGLAAQSGNWAQVFYGRVAAAAAERPVSISLSSRTSSHTNSGTCCCHRPVTRRSASCGRPSISIIRRFGDSRTTSRALSARRSRAASATHHGAVTERPWRRRPT